MTSRICDITGTGLESGTVEEFCRARPDLSWHRHLQWGRYVVWDDLDESWRAFVLFGYDLDELVEKALRIHYE